MIVDFTSTKKELEKIANIHLREEVRRRTPFLGMIGKHIIHEGNEQTYETVDKKEQKMEFKKAEAVFSVTAEEMGKIKFPEILKRMEVAAEEIAKQTEQGAFKEIFKKVEEVGNMIPGNPPFSSEAFLKGLEMIEIDFDGARDKPSLPTVVVHPSQFEKMKEQEAKMTDEERKEFEIKKETILDKKYKEYVAREEKRKLID